MCKPVSISSLLIFSATIGTSIFIGLSAINRAKNLDFISHKIPDLFKVNAINSQQAYLLASLAFTLASIVLLGCIYGIAKSVSAHAQSAHVAPNGTTGATTKGKSVGGYLEVTGGVVALVVAASTIVPIVDLSLYISGKNDTILLHKIGFTQPFKNIGNSIMGNSQATPVITMLAIASFVLLASMAGGVILCLNGAQKTPQCCVSAASICCPCSGTQTVNNVYYNPTLAY